jgi:hypothetical protein
MRNRRSGSRRSSSAEGGSRKGFRHSLEGGLQASRQLDYLEGAIAARLDALRCSLTQVAWLRQASRPTEMDDLEGAGEHAASAPRALTLIQTDDTRFFLTCQRVARTDADAGNLFAQAAVKDPIPAFLLRTGYTNGCRPFSAPFASALGTGEFARLAPHTPFRAFHCRG